MPLVRFWAAHASEFAVLLQQHVLLVLVSTLAAIVVGVPAGIAAARRPRMGRVILAVASVAQTIPSLALLGFVLPLPIVGGIGPRTALVALFTYALLPIVRSTCTGLQQVDPAALAAGTAVGMTAWERLTLVELPLALPSIVTGIRLATVIGVGTTTIAAAIGAGGLGEYIFRGLSMVDTTMILAGAVPAAACALVADALLGWVERRLAADPRPVRLAGPAAVLLAILGASIAGPSGPRATNLVTVGSKNTTEQIILGELAAQAIERESGGPVVRKLNLGGTFVCDQGLRTGDLDVYVEYTGTSVAAIFKDTVPHDPAEALARARRLYADAGISALEPLGFNNTFAILVRGADARSQGWRSIGDLSAAASRLRPGFGHEFLEREDGYPGLARAYGLTFGTAPRGMELSLIYRALQGGEVDVIAGDATSALIDVLDLQPLADAQHYFPPYDAVPLVRTASLLRQPAIGRALGRLAGRITDKDMRAMNAAVDVAHRDARDVAREFLAALPGPAPEP